MDLLIPSQTLCFTGHRPHKLGGYDENNPIAKHVKGLLTTAIISTYEQGFRTYISGGALGVDQLAAQLVLDLQPICPEAQLVIARPFPSQDKIWPSTSQKIFRELCTRAHQIIDVNPDGPDVVGNLQRRNIWMVDHSSLVIAVWDGTSGGTANCIRYAKIKDKSILYLNPKP